MRTDIVVFLGPTVDAKEARSHLDAVYLPPVGAGDVVNAVRNLRPAAIAIIDGVFADRPAVRHKELLWAISGGVKIHGAASMGAIRAAELADFGMIGSGLIYRWYRRVHLADDADVAVAMCPPELGSVALTDALVDIRTTLKRAERAGVIRRESRLVLEDLARRMHFSRRTYSHTIAAARAPTCVVSSTEIRALEAWLQINRHSQKRHDAIRLLQSLSGQKYEKYRFQPKEYVLTDAWHYDLNVDRILDKVAKNGNLLSE